MHNRLHPTTFALCVALSLGGCRCDEPTDGSADAGETTDTSLDLGRDVAEAASDAGPDLSVDERVALCVPGGAVRWTVGYWTVAVDPTDGSWEASVDGERAVRGTATCGGGGFATMTGKPSVREAFGAFQIDLFADSATWEARRPATAGMRDDALSIEAGDASLLFEARGEELHVRLDAAADGGEFSLRCDENESFFGLGGQVTTLDLRGRTYPLWSQEQGNSKPESGGTWPLSNFPEAAYAPMGIWHSTTGYSALVDHDAYSELDLCETDEGRVTLRSFGALPGAVFVAGTPKARMTRVTEYTGRVRDDLPDWTFGLWLDAVTGPERLEEVASTLRAEGIPASAIWTEDWIGGTTTTFGFRLSYDWSWEPDLYPDLPSTVDGLHRRGFAFLTYFNPFVPDTTDIYPEAVAGGYLVKDAEGEDILFRDPAFRDAGLVDLSNDAALTWLESYQMTAVTEIGADGWMADFAEWLSPMAVMSDGASGWEYHNLYPVAWQRANAAHLAAAKESIGEQGNWVFFSRSGWASANGGTPGTASVMWGGDQNTTWGYDDGFPTIVPIGTHMGLSGVAVFGSDIAGYNSQTNLPHTSKDLWFRWASAGAFHPVMRTHHGGSECENWNFDRDAETLAHTRRWSSIHTLLYPEFRRLYVEAVATGLPMTRHPWLVEPDDARLWTGDDYVWFLGDDLLIAPVLSEGALGREVELPAAGWWPLFGDAPEDSDLVTADAAMTEIPVFVRPGRALTLLAEPVDSFYPNQDAGVRGLEDSTGYRVALYPDADGAAITAGDSPVLVGAANLDGWDVSSATFDGAALPGCEEPVTGSCVGGETVTLVDVVAGRLEVGSATIDLDAEGPVVVTLGIAGSAWAEWASPTGFTPNPDAESWCRPEE